jgi:hypothetical protein
LGLLQTVTSVGGTISALDTNGGESTMMFDQLKQAPGRAPEGMGTAFSCLMFGLALSDPGLSICKPACPKPLF